MTLFAQAADKSPSERSALLEASDDLASAHAQASHAGQTEAPPLETEVTTHYSTFVAHKGCLIELEYVRITVCRC